jgi:hypothetical protein
MTRSTLLTLITAVSAAVVAGSRVYVRYSRDWGSSAAERAMALPGDDLVPGVASQSTMAITIAAPPDDVWPWLVQMGVDRAGFYTHTWVENGLFRLGVRNAERIEPAWQELRVGDRLRFTQPGSGSPLEGPIVTAIEPGRALVACNGDDPTTCFGSWQFVLRPTAEGGTRLILRSRSAEDRPRAFRILDPVLEPGYVYMDIGMLRGIRDRAEQAAGTAPQHV